MSILAELSAGARATRASSGETRHSLGEGGKPDTTDRKFTASYRASLPQGNISTFHGKIEDQGYYVFALP